MGEMPYNPMKFLIPKGIKVQLYSNTGTSTTGIHSTTGMSTPAVYYLKVPYSRSIRVSYATPSVLVY